MNLSKFLFCFGALAIGPLAIAQTCSNNSLRGTYAYTINGTVNGANNTAVTNSQVGRIVFNGTGGYTGFLVAAAEGAVGVAEFTGTYAVDSSCVGAGKSVVNGTSTDFDFVVVNGGNDFNMVLRAAGATLSGAGTKSEGLAACNLASMNATFGYQSDGLQVVNAKTVSTAEVGLMTFDGRGGLSAGGSFVSEGNSVLYDAKGTYEMTPECFGVAVYKVGEVTYQVNFMLTSGGNQIIFTELAGTYIASGSGTRTFPR
ncbi:MAG: hypothetical protein K2X03_10785 [Bryobacteraceae bacterium]|nr:hypothetical protein [Bryobacteraceae bacterium]